MQSGSKLISEGTPTALNRLTRYHTVQELATVASWNSTASSQTLVDIPATSLAVLPELRGRFTDFSVLGNPICPRRQHISGTMAV